jgi:cysteine desulfurase
VKPSFEVESGVPYVDNAVTTALREEVLEAMLPFLQEKFADPEEPYEPGIQAREALEGFRASIAEMVGADPDNVWFTSGGTEANNWVIRCQRRSGMPVCSAVEHLSVLANATTHMDVGPDGTLESGIVQQSLDMEDISVMSVQHANQDTGVVQDIPAVAKLCGEYGIPLHVDAAMSFGVVPVSLFDLGANFLTLSSHKAWGPVGAGALVSDGKYELNPFIRGGGQERGMRAGPVNMAAVAGFAAAAEFLRTSLAEWKSVSVLRDRIETELRDVTKVQVVGAAAPRLPNMSCLVFPGSDAAFLAAELERLYGMCVGVGGTAEEGTASRVLDAMGVPRVSREAAIRMRYGPRMTRQEADQVIVGLCSALRAEEARPIF